MSVDESQTLHEEFDGKKENDKTESQILTQK